MEKSSPPPPDGQVNQVKPLRTTLTFGRYRWFQHTTPERAKEIGKSPSRLRAFRDAKTDVSQLARLADVDGQKDSFPPGRTAIDDVRDAMVAGNFETFFTVLTLYGPRGHFACLSDSTILGITQGWWDAANSGNKNARNLLTKINAALARASYRRPPLPATEQPLSNRDAVAVFNVGSVRLRRYIDFRETRSPEEACYLIEEELNENRHILPKRKPAILSSFRRRAKKWEQTRSGHKA